MSIDKEDFKAWMAEAREDRKDQTLQWTGALDKQTSSFERQFTRGFLLIGVLIFVVAALGGLNVYYKGDAGTLQLTQPATTGTTPPMSAKAAELPYTEAEALHADEPTP